MDSTSFQRLFVRCGLRERGLDTFTVSAAHQPLFAEVGASVEPGADLDAALRGLTREQAEGLCRQLRSTQ